MKSTITEVIAARREAGAVYAAAAKAYIEAWVRLKSYDMALSNGNVGAIDAGRGFVGIAEALPHYEFLPDSLHHGLVDRATAQHEQIIRSLQS